MGAHLSVVEAGSAGDLQFETDRGKFLTRNKSARSAAAIFEGWPLSNSAGPVLDPVFSLRRRIQIPRGQSVTIAFWTMAAASREEILDLVDRHHDAASFERATTLAATHAQTQLQYLGIGGDDAHLFQLLASYLIYHDGGLRAPPEILESGGRPPSALWGAGNIRRPSHRPGPDRCRERDRLCAPDGARARILAPEAPGGRSGDPERTSRLLCAGFAEIPGDLGAQRPMERRWGRGGGQDFPAAP